MSSWFWFWNRLLPCSIYNNFTLLIKEWLIGLLFLFIYNCNYLFKEFLSWPGITAKCQPSPLFSYPMGIKLSGTSVYFTKFLLYISAMLGWRLEDVDVRQHISRSFLRWRVPMLSPICSEGKCMWNRRSPSPDDDAPCRFQIELWLITRHTISRKCPKLPISGHLLIIHPKWGLLLCCKFIEDLM